MPIMDKAVVQYKLRILFVQALNQPSQNAHTQAHLELITVWTLVCNVPLGQLQVCIICMGAVCSG